MAEFLYIHIPYCIRKCLYCDFLSLPFNEQAARRYVESLCRELEIKNNIAGKLKTIFIGGGTPTLLPVDCFRQLFDCLRENFESFSRNRDIGRGKPRDGKCIEDRKPPLSGHQQDEHRHTVLS